MPTVAGIKIKTKPPRVRNPLFADEKYTGGEPEWPQDAIEWSDEDFDHLLRKSFFYYNYFYNQKDTKKHVEEWAEKSGLFDKVQINAFKRSADRSIPMTACSLIMAHRAGMPLKENHIEFLKKSIITAITDAEPDPDEITTKPKPVAEHRPNIQDRLAEKTAELIGEMEGIFDEIIKNNKPNFKPYDFLTTNKVIQAQLPKYRDVFENRKFELELAQAKTDPQLTEAYRHYKTADFKRIIAWLELVLLAIDEYRQVKQATKKARVKKAPTKEKLIAKLKYAKDFKELKLVSINPAEIIGANELWIYNTKTRKLGKYVAAAHSQLSVKGTGIENFDSDKSICKTLRKPQEKMKEFNKASKVTLRKFLDEIKATETKLNGRISSDIVLLKVA
jgi:hypothetical protein